MAMLERAQSARTQVSLTRTRGPDQMAVPGPSRPAGVARSASRRHNPAEGYRAAHQMSMKADAAKDAAQIQHMLDWQVRVPFLPSCKRTGSLAVFRNSPTLPRRGRRGVGLFPLPHVLDPHRDFVSTLLHPPPPPSPIVLTAAPLLCPLLPMPFLIHAHAFI